MAVFHEYPYTDFHDLNLDWLLKTVKDLKEEIDNLDLDEWQSRLTACETTLNEHASDIQALEGEYDSLYQAITTLQTTVTSHTADISTINGAIDDLDRVVNGLVNEQYSQGQELTQLENNVRAISQSVDILEPQVAELMESAFGELVLSANNFYFGGDFRDLSKVDYEIVNDVVDGSNPSILLGNAGSNRDYPEYPTRQMIAFKNTGDQCHLILRNFMLGKYNISELNYNPLLYFGALIWRYAYQNSDYYHNDTGATVSTLISGYVAPNNGNHKGLFKDMQLVLNTSGNYDLYIYNGRNGYVANGTHYISYFVCSTQLIDTVTKFMDKLMAYQWHITKEISSQISDTTPTLVRSTISTDLADNTSALNSGIKTISDNEYKSLNNYVNYVAITGETGVTVNSQELTISPQMYPYPDWSVGDSKYMAIGNFDVTISSLANKTYQQIGTVGIHPSQNIPITCAPVDANKSLRMYGLLRPTGEVLLYVESSDGQALTDYRFRGSYCFTYTP